MAKRSGTIRGEALCVVGCGFGGVYICESVNVYGRTEAMMRWLISDDDEDGGASIFHDACQIPHRHTNNTNPTHIHTQTQALLARRRPDSLCLPSLAIQAPPAARSLSPSSFFPPSTTYTKT